MPIIRGVGGVNRTVKEIVEGVGNVNKKVAKQLVNFNGVMRKVFEIKGILDLKSLMVPNRTAFSTGTNYAPTVRANGNLLLQTWSSSTSGAPQYSVASSNAKYTISSAATFNITLKFWNGFHIDKDTNIKIYYHNDYGGEVKYVVQTIKAGTIPLEKEVTYSFKPGRYGEFYIHVELYDKGGQTTSSVEILDIFLTDN